MHTAYSLSQVPRYMHDRILFTDHLLGEHVPRLANSVTQIHGRASSVTGLKDQRWRVDENKSNSPIWLRRAVSELSPLSPLTEDPQAFR